MQFGLAANSAEPTKSIVSFVGRHCVTCHGPQEKKGELDLESLTVFDPGRDGEIWERVVRKLRTRQMPPAGNVRPSEDEYNAASSDLESALDQASQRTPNPGRTDTFRRLNRTEYRNAIRDLFALDVDVSAWLPADESSHGFDNVTVGDLSATLLNRHISLAQKISRLAVGTAGTPGTDIIRIRPDMTQEEHVQGLPLGTRGGTVVRHTFPQTGHYELQIRLTRDRNEEVEGLYEPHKLELLLDREHIQSFEVKPPPGRIGFENVDLHLKARIWVTAGPHQLGATFAKRPSSLLETKRQPYQAHFNMHRHPRLTPAIFQIAITGPYSGKSGDETPSRLRVFSKRPSSSTDEESTAKELLAVHARRAFRRPVGDEDLATPLKFFREARANGGFDAGIEAALGSILLNPHFLFRIERDPENLPPGSIYQINDLQLASRLSFFLWSSIPDDELLGLAERGELRQSGVLEQQVRRMLSDPRSQSLITNFAEQWLYLRNLDSITPDLRLFPDFDDNLRQAFRQETELFIESVMREDRSVLDLLRADYTYLNERLAKHYGIPHVYGSRFRRVALDHDSHRGGLLRHGSVLTVTSYATRTSPVIRGHWVLKNLVGAPPPPPPANVPALKDNTVSDFLPIRERLAQHRANEACAGCHNLMDPVGFALENFDAVGRWRQYENGHPIDALGVLPDGQEFTGVQGLERSLLQRPELFVGTMAEKLLTFALGRGVDHFDAPAIRKIVRDAKKQDYRFSALIIGIAQSTPMQMRKSQ